MNFIMTWFHIIIYIWEAYEENLSNYELNPAWELVALSEVGIYQKLPVVIIVALTNDPSSKLVLGQLALGS